MVWRSSEQGLFALVEEGRFSRSDETVPWEMAAPKRAPFCVRLCGLLDRFCTALWFPPFDAKYAKRQRLQQRLVSVYTALSLLGALYPFYFLTFLQRSFPSVRPLWGRGGEFEMMSSPASAGEPRADFEAKVGGSSSGPEAFSAWSAVAFVPERTEHLYSFDHGLVYALLYWGVSAALPLQALLLLASHAAARVERTHAEGSRCSVCAAITSLNGRVLLLHSLWAIVLSALSALNLTSFFAATTREAAVELYALSWGALVFSLFVQLPLGIHARNLVRFFEGASALGRMRFVVEQEEQQRLLAPPQEAFLSDAEASSAKRDVSRGESSLLEETKNTREETSAATATR